MDDSTHREKAREAIQNGKLPTRSPDRITGGPGCGGPCALCGDPVRRTQMELEPEFRQEGEAPAASSVPGRTQGLEAALHKYHLHPRCFMAWEFERGQD
jgi:hypothetical protein